MRRETDITTICCALSVREQFALEVMKAQTGITSDANLVRVALYRFAAHLDVATDVALFAVRRPRGRMRKGTAA
jgi:hypothetical protein